MLRRHAIAPLRGLVLFGLSIVGLVQFVVVFAVSVTGVLLFDRERWLPNLCRRLVRDWTGVDIPRPYRSRPAPAEPEKDGWYRDGNQLHRRPGWVNTMRWINWLLEDPATHRDHLWALLTPVTGGLAAVVPAALIGGAFFAPPLAAVPLVLLGFAAGPLMIQVYGWWCGSLLGPITRAGRSRFWAWVMTGVNGLGQLGAMIGMSVWGLVYAALTILSIFPGMVQLLPAMAGANRYLISYRRHQIGKWTGVSIPEPYLPPPAPPVPRPDGKFQLGRFLYDSPRPVARARRIGGVLTDKATWRDLAWLVLDPLVCLVLGAVPLGLVIIGFVGFVWRGLWNWILSWGTEGPGWLLVDDVFGWLDQLPTWSVPVVGLALTGVALLMSPRLVKLHAWWSRSLLSPTKSAKLARRVDHLTETRSAATDAQAAELRRIERDLHDGAQARWVAMGLNLGAVEQLIDKDPAAAKKLLANARNASAEALVELRQLVRGILPPVLSERGLGDAVRALALDSALDVHVAVVLPGSLDAPVEAAVYFAISELLTNAAKHGEAERVSIDIRYVDGLLRVNVVDDGHGGADPDAGTGLKGLRRRLATFDGELTITSPRGGPTTATLEVPCALSSPRTSTSSETA